MKRLILFILFFQLTTSLAFGQDFLEKQIDFEVSNLPIDQALIQLSNQAAIDIAFSKNFFRDADRITLQVKDKPIREIIDLILENTNIEYKTLGENRVLLFKTIIEYLSVSGYLEEEGTGERIVGGRVFLLGTNFGALTNEYGYFSFEIPINSGSITVRALGYKNTSFSVQNQSKSGLIIALEPADDLPTIVVSADEDTESLSNSGFTLDRDNVLEISRRLPKKLPTLGGAADIIQVAQLIPGVQGQAEGFGGINIRGGESGQNLMLMDGTPVYIPYHLLGLYSAYNPETVRSLKLVKGNFPARYGDAVSSVLDVQIREGDRSQWRSTAELNLLSANASIEGPFKNKKGSFLIAGRYSPRAYFFEPTLSRLYFQNQIDDLNATFYDLNIKLNYDVSPKDRLYLSFFSGKDAILQSALTVYDSNNKSFSSFDLGWSNLVGSFRWNHLVGPKLFINTTLTFSKYATQFTSQNEFLYEDAMAINKDLFLIDNRSENRDIGLKIDADYTCSKHHNFRFGGQFNLKYFVPRFYFSQETQFDIIEEDIGKDLYDINVVYESLNVTNYRIGTGAIYVEDQLHYGRWYANFGARLSGFFTDSSARINIEPRLLLKYKINEKLTTSLSGNRRVQYLHLISNPSIQLPNDLWLPSGKSVRPQELYEFEYALNFMATPKLRFNLVAYQRYMKNIYAYPETFDFLFTTDDYNKFDFLVSGKGQVQGLEFMADCGDEKRGLLVSYTLSKSTRQFDSINLGLPFASNFDSRHQFKLAYQQHLFKTFRVGVNWIFRTPSPHVNVIQFASSGTFSNINQDPPGYKNTTLGTFYNRIDISMQYTLVGEKTEHFFKFGIYNVLNSQNTAFYEIQYIDVTTNEIYSNPLKSLPILPSFSYKISFKNNCKSVD